MPIKGKSKTTKKRICWCVKHHSDERKKVDWYWIRELLSLSLSLLSAYEISKKVTHLLRHSQIVQREDDGAIQFWRIKNFLQNQYPQIIYWSDDRWKACLSEGGGAKRRYQCCTDISGTIIYFLALQRHSGDVSSLIFHCRTMIFLTCSPHWMCFLSSFYHQQWIDTWRSEFKRQTVFFLPIDPRDKDHQDPATIDFNKPRRAQYMHSAWRKHQDAVFWVDFNLAIQKGLNILSDSIECNHSSTTTKDLISTRSRLDQRESSIGFYN